MSSRFQKASSHEAGAESVVDRELDRLASLAPNWDYEGAKAIDQAIIDAARSLMAELSPNLARLPKVVPMAKGNLQFEWHQGERSLELEIEDPATIHYLKWHPEEGIEEEGTFPLSEASLAVELIRWFMRGVTNV
jgi:hypothetical protein